MTAMSSTRRLHRQTAYSALLAVLRAGSVAAMHAIPGHGTGQASMTASEGSHPGDGDGDAAVRLTAFCLGVVGSLLLVFGPPRARSTTRPAWLRRHFQVYYPSPVATAGGGTDLYLRLCVLRR